MAKDTEKLIREYLAKIGRKGGNARARKYDKAMLSKWAKKGGRPTKSKQPPKRKTRRSKAGAKE